MARQEDTRLLRLARARMPRVANRLHCAPGRSSESRLQATQSSTAQHAARHSGTVAVGTAGPGGGSAVAPESEAAASSAVSQQLASPVAEAEVEPPAHSSGATAVATAGCIAMTMSK